MSRPPIETRPTTAQWLIRAREAAGFTNAKTFLAAVKAAEGKAPSYSSYAQWESGEVTPRSASLKPVAHFHEARETAAKPAKAEKSLELRAVEAAEAQAKALTRIAEFLTGRAATPTPGVAEAVAALLGTLGSGLPQDRGDQEQETR